MRSDWKVICLIIIILAAFTAALLIIGFSEAEAETYSAICNPKSTINIREGASKSYDVVGFLMAGDTVEVVGQKHGFYQVKIGIETGGGYVSSGYLVDGNVTTYDGGATYVVVADGRVRVRTSVDGDFKCWVQPEETVTVYAIGGGWAYTDKGYMKDEYLEAIK